MYLSEVYGENGIYSKAVQASVGTSGTPMYSLECRYHRFILAEVNTHRMLGKSSSSSRAIPVNKMLDRILQDPAVPIEWGLNQAGMQAVKDHNNPDMCMEAWLDAAKDAVKHAAILRDLDLHKQLSNRLIEAFMMTTTIISGTEWGNLFYLRCHPAAQPEFQELAKCMRESIEQVKPVFQMWHLPYVTDEERAKYPVEKLARVSAARCARVSYTNHDQSDPNIEEDLGLFGELMVRPFERKNRSYTADDPVHESPADHVAFEHGVFPSSDVTLGVLQWPIGTTAIQKSGSEEYPFEFWSGNLRNWSQFRHLLSAQGHG